MSKMEYELATAVRRGDRQTLERILHEHPALADEPNIDGDTLLHIACLEKQVGLLGLLIECGADVNKRGKGGRTPLHYAVQDGRAISLLLVSTLCHQYGADRNIRDDFGLVPADLARLEMRNSLPEVLALLEDTSSPESREAKALRDLTREALALPALDSVGRGRMMSVARALATELRKAWDRGSRRR